MVTDALAVHPFISVPVTVYVVVDVRVAVTLLPVVTDKPVAGAQLYCSAPLAASGLPVVPPHTVLLGLTVITGVPTTCTLTVERFTQPFRSVPVTV